MADIKVFRMNDFEWWAGETLEACIAHWKDARNGRVEVELDDPRELDSSEMAQLQYMDDPGTEVKWSFDDELARRVKADAEFPQFFATTEY